MNQGKTVFAQLLQFVPFSYFEHLADVYQANKGVKTSLAVVAERRDYRLFEALGQRLTVAALALYGDEDLGLGLKGPVFAMDSTTIDLCLSLFPWAHFRQTKAAVKAHVIMDLRGAIPVFISITTGKVHDVRLLNAISLPAGSILVVDRGYLDFERLFALHRQQIGLVIRAKDNLRSTWVASRKVDTQTGLRADQTILLATPKSKLGYPERLRRVSFRDPETGKHLVFLTNLHDVPALTIVANYKMAVCAYLLVLIAIRHHRLPVSPQIFLHPVETNIFEKITLDQLVANAVVKEQNEPTGNKLILL
jgi:hypothetical protein